MLRKVFPFFLMFNGFVLVGCTDSYHEHIYMGSSGGNRYGDYPTPPQAVIYQQPALTLLPPAQRVIVFQQSSTPSYKSLSYNDGYGRKTHSEHRDKGKSSVVDNTTGVVQEAALIRIDGYYPKFVPVLRSIPVHWDWKSTHHRLTRRSALQNQSAFS